MPPRDRRRSSKPPPGVGERRVGERRKSARPLGIIGVPRPFQLVRHFSLWSLASILVAAILMTVLYRQMAVAAIVNFGERNNLMVAQSALISIKPQLIRYLDTVSTIPAGKVVAYPMDRAIQSTILDLMEQTTVVRVKIYNRRGAVAFSTKADQIGDDQSANEGVVDALGGKVASELVYRDAFNAFDKVTEEDNLIQTYLPVLHNGADGPHGAFEIYTDVNQMVEQVERAEWVVLGGSVTSLLVLYGVLLLIVRRGAALIDQQQQTIRERTQTLEQLSAQMLSAQEAEKQRLAHRLHEGVGQNLAAIKMLTEQELNQGSAEERPRRAELVELIREAIGDVTSLAVGLHPPSLDDFGLLRTLNTLPREYENRYPQLRVETRLAVDEAQMPPGLKVVIYRVAQESLDAIGRAGSARRAELSLTADAEGVQLTVADDGPAYHAATAEDLDGALTWAAARERTVLSGGRFSVASDHHGGTVCRSSWDLTEEAES